MTLNEGLIRNALLKAKPADLENVLTAIEAYRTCVATAQRLIRNPSMETQRQQVLECAAFCEEKLATYAATGRLMPLHFPNSQMESAHIVLAIEWSQ